MLREVIVVEGKSDIDRVRLAVHADVIATGGLALRSRAVEEIRKAYGTRGIIILTDPDGPGERIRRKLTRLFPRALHAFVPKEEAKTETDVGIEQASPESIRKALHTLRVSCLEEREFFTWSDLVEAGLSGQPQSAKKRIRMGALLGIGYGNGKQFLKRLNRYGVTEREWTEALAICEKERL